MCCLDIAQLKQSKTTLDGYSGTNLSNLGTIKLDSKPVHSRIRPLKALFYIMKQGKTPILGLKTFNAVQAFEIAE